MPTPGAPDYYELLQVSRTAQPLMITKAYRLLAAFYHPDNQETGDREAFENVLAAYRVLCDPVRRPRSEDEREFRGRHSSLCGICEGRSSSR